VFRPKIDKLNPTPDEDMRLNKYVALCGVAARRKASELIQMGEITVNGGVVTEPGTRVLPTDVVRHNGAILKPVEKKIYLLLNKPKDTITTVTDERGRKTVMDLVSRTVKERIFPVGRLDRDTTGLLVLTNDGDLAQKLSHPSYRIRKLYHVELNKALTKNDLEAIATGIELEDGKAEVDAINYVEGAKKNEVMVEIHIGKNRIVRRIFENLGYEVERLDRVFYGGLTKKDLPRGDYRSLTEREIIMLKHFTGK
jgi:23S rRNA pseudouridine2605 synthase